MMFGVLVGKFGDLVRTRSESSTVLVACEDTDYPEALAHLRERLNHHLVPLILMARSDGSLDATECAAIVDHCRRIHSLGDDEAALLSAYVGEFRPSLMQLDPALRRLEIEEAHNLEALFHAAEMVMLADGRIDAAEMKLLDLMREDLANLQT